MSTTPTKENDAAAVASNDGGVKTPNSVRARVRRDAMVRTGVFKFKMGTLDARCDSPRTRRTSRAVMRRGSMTDECEVCACGV